LNKNVEFIALGGISDSNKNKLNLLNISGFAGIYYLQKITGPNRGRFNY